MSVFIPFVPPNPGLWVLVATIRNRRLQQTSQSSPNMSPGSHQIGVTPTNLVLQRKDGSLIVNCPKCVQAQSGDMMARKGFAITRKGQP